MANLVLVLVLVASFTVGVAPGSDDDNEAPVDAVVADEGMTDDKGLGVKGSSGSLGKSSVYNTLAWLLHRTNHCH